MQGPVEAIKPKGPRKAKAETEVPVQQLLLSKVAQQFFQGPGTLPGLSRFSSSLAFSDICL